MSSTSKTIDKWKKKKPLSTFKKWEKYKQMGVNNYKSSHTDFTSRIDKGPQAKNDMTTNVKKNE